MAQIERAPVVVVPGIKASGLDDYYPPERETLWSAVLSKAYDRVAMHPDDLRFEAMEPAMVRPNAPFAIVYKDLVEALRYELATDPRKPVPVFAFGYDWRQDCFRSAAQLELMVEEALARTRLLPHYRKHPPARVDVVAHSMGGLVVALLLALRGKAARIRRVVTMGAPFGGAIDAVSLLAMGMANFWGEVSREREREAARSMSSVYQLLPWYETAVASEVPEYRDLYAVEAWQRSVVETLDAYRKRLSADITGEELLRALLGNAKAVRDALRGLDLAKALEEGRAGWLAIAGANVETMVAMSIERQGRSPRFVWSQPRNDWPGIDTGDGTVALRGAVAPFLDAGQVACVTPEDFSFWELKDRAIATAGGFHAALPVMNLVQRLAIRFLRADYRGPVWARPFPGAAATRWPEWLKPRE